MRCRDSASVGGRRQTKFLLRMLLIVAMATLLAAAAVTPLFLAVWVAAGELGLPGTGPADPSQTTSAADLLLYGLALLMLALQLYLGLSVSLALPATALDRSQVIRLSWALTRGVTFRFLVAFLLVTVPFFAVALIVDWAGVYQVAPVSGTLIGLLVNLVAMAAGYAVLAIAYRRLGGPMPAGT